MKLKNISKKIVHVGMNMLLPDSDMNIAPGLAKLPSIQALVAKGVLAIEEDKAPETPAAPEDTKDPEAPADPTDAPKAPEKPKRAKKDPEANPAE